MTKTSWHQNVERFVDKWDGKARLNSIIKREIPQGQRLFWQRYDSVHRNPNIDFRIQVYQPFLERARDLVKTYQDDYDEIRKAIERNSYKDPIELALQAGKDIASPGPWSIIPTPEFISPGSQVLDALEGIGDFVHKAGTGIEWKLYSTEHRIKNVFWMQLDQLIDDLSGRGGNKLEINNLLREQAKSQMRWDEELSKIPKETIREAFKDWETDDKTPRWEQGRTSTGDDTNQSDELSNSDILAETPPWESLPSSTADDAGSTDELSGSDVSDEAPPWESLPTTVNDVSPIDELSDSDISEQTPTWESLPTSTADDVNQLDELSDSDVSEQTPSNEFYTIGTDDDVSQTDELSDSDISDQTPPWESLPTSTADNVSQPDELSDSDISNEAPPWEPLPTSIADDAGPADDDFNNPAAI